MFAVLSVLVAAGQDTVLFDLQRHVTRRLELRRVFSQRQPPIEGETKRVDKVPLAHRHLVPDAFTLSIRVVGLPFRLVLDADPQLACRPRVR